MDPAMRLLLAGSESAMTQDLPRALLKAALATELAPSGRVAAEMLRRYPYDLILLPLWLPDMSGLEVLQDIRSSRIETPVLMLGDDEALSDKLAAFGAGADDYLGSPFHVEELIARVRAITRRAKGHVSSIIYTGQLALNINTRTVEVRGRSLQLTAMEYQILEILSQRKDDVVSKAALLERLYAGGTPPATRVLSVLISRLRKKIGDANQGESYVVTVPGQGYALRDGPLRNS